MAHKSATVAAIEEISLTDKIINLAQRGKQPLQIAEELGISRMTVTRHMDDWLAVSSTRIAAQIEKMHIIELERLEFIYSQVAASAFPHYDEVMERMTPIDERQIELLIKVIKEKREWQKSIKEAARKDKEGSIVNIDHIEVTISQNNPLYKVANENINEERWAKYADIGVDELYNQAELTIEAQPSYGLPEQIEEVGKFVPQLEELLNKPEVDDGG